MALGYSQLNVNDAVQLASNEDQRAGQRITSTSSKLIGNQLNKITVKLENRYRVVGYDVTAYVLSSSGIIKSQSLSIPVSQISTQPSDVSFDFQFTTNVELGDIVAVGVNGGLVGSSSLSMYVTTSNSDPTSNFVTYRNGKWINQFGGKADMYLQAYYDSDVIIPPIVIPPSIIISPEAQIILNKFDSGDYIISSDVNSGIELVRNGTITSELFISTFNNLLENRTITDKTIQEPIPIYNFIIESDGLVRMFRIGALEYTEIKIQPESVQSFIDRGVSRLLTAAERAIPYPRPEPEPESTFCVNAYNIRESGSVYATSYLAITAAKVAELKLTQFVLSCEATTLPTEKEIQDFYGFTPIPPEVDTTINSTMVSQSVGSFILKDGIVKGEILYIANQSFNPFYYGKNLTSLVQIKSKSGVVLTIKPNMLNFTETERDETITIDESAGNFKELLIDFFVWDSPLSQIIFSETKQIQIVDETDVDPVDPFDPQPPVTTCPAGYHKDFSGKCVPDDPVGEIPRDKLIDTLKGFLFGTVALSLLARKY